MPLPLRMYINGASGVCTALHAQPTAYSTILDSARLRSAAFSLSINTIRLLRSQLHSTQYSERTPNQIEHCTTAKRSEAKRSMAKLSTTGPTPQAARPAEPSKARSPLLFSSLLMLERRGGRGACTVLPHLSKFEWCRDMQSIRTHTRFSFLFHPVTVHADPAGKNSKDSGVECSLKDRCR